MAALTDHEKALARLVAARSELPQGGTELLHEVAGIFGVSVEQITSENRAARLVDARMVIASALNERGWTTLQIAALINRTQSSTHHLIQRMQQDFELRRLSKEVA